MKINAIGLLTLVGLLSACNTYKVIHFSNDLPADSMPKTYQLENLKSNKENEEEGRVKPPLIKELEEEIQEQMKLRDYQVAFFDPDLILRYEIIANQISEISTTHNRFYRGMYNPYWGNFSQRDFTESILLLEIRDNYTNRTLWQASLDMRYTRRNKSILNVVVDAVERIFETYPFTADPEKVP